MRIWILLFLGVLIFGCISGPTSFEDCEKECAVKNLPGEERYVCKNRGGDDWYCADTKFSKAVVPPVEETKDDNFSFLPDYNPEINGSCSDLDGGFKPETIGKIMMDGQPTAAEDYCVHGTLLREYVCTYNYSTYEYTEVECYLPLEYDYAKYGGPCQEGRCIFGAK